MPLVPILGILINLALMAGLGAITWVAFLVWMGIGLVVYFAYRRKTSHLQNPGRGFTSAS